MKKEIALAVRGPVIDRRLLLTSQPRGVLSPRSSVIEQTLRPAFITSIGSCLFGRVFEGV